MKRGCRGVGVVWDDQCIEGKVLGGKTMGDKSQRMEGKTFFEIGEEKGALPVRKGRHIEGEVIGERKGVIRANVWKERPFFEIGEK